MKRCQICDLLRVEVDIKPVYISRESFISMCIKCSSNMVKKFTSKEDLK